MKEFFGLASNIIKSNFTELKKPYKLNFAVTYHCQSRCAMCNIWNTKPTNELSIEEIVEFARKNPYFNWIELTGGEIFLRSDLVDIVRVFRKYSNLYLLTIPTNSLCSHELVKTELKDMLKLGIPKIAVTVSLDGYKELHDSIRGIPGNYEKAINMFRMLTELKKEFKNLYFVFGYTMSKLNEGKFIETFEKVKKDIPKLKFNDFHINVVQMSDNYYGNSDNNITPNKEIVAGELREIIKNREKEFGVIPSIENTFLKNLIKYAETGKIPFRSRSLEASFFLDSYGNVFPSIMWNEKIGNIRECGYSLDVLWNTESAKKIRDRIKKGDEPMQWTSCEAYQSIVGNMKSMI